ncbi:MAG: helix-turn-helix transcriptional regulator [Oscillospiraceae bacterium]|nr:helix-turn-helix transcriptional regulator [Oscillospiraceae bacterium]
MEPKTIGSFIAALRKAQGLTQKELAEKLDVSDKSVSRWERDEGLPDLSLIPVIAEVFDVTCDELLRGERKSAEDRNISSAKGEKQLQRILLSGTNRFQNRSYIAMGIYILGLIVVLIAAFGYGKAQIGFLIGCAFYLAGIICQVIFKNQAFMCVADTDFCQQDVWRYRERVIRFTQCSVGLSIFLATFSLPLTDILTTLIGRIYAQDLWALLLFIARKLIYPLAAVGVWYLIYQLRYKSMIINGTIQITPERDTVRIENKQAKRKCTKWLLVAMAATLAVQILLNLFLPVSLFEEPSKTFDDYESFAGFMERDIDTNPEKIRTKTLKDRDGNILCQYERKNFSVKQIRYEGTTDKYLPISVYTTGNMQIYNASLRIINICMLFLYPMETAVTAFCYLKKRKEEP